MPKNTESLPKYFAGDHVRVVGVRGENVDENHSLHGAEVIVQNYSHHDQGYAGYMVMLIPEHYDCWSDREFYLTEKYMTPMEPPPSTQEWEKLGANLLNEFIQINDVDREEFFGTRLQDSLETLKKEDVS